MSLPIHSSLCFFLRRRPVFFLPFSSFRRTRPHLHYKRREGWQSRFIIPRNLRNDRQFQLWAKLQWRFVCGNRPWRSFRLDLGETWACWLKTRLTFESKFQGSVGNKHITTSFPDRTLHLTTGQGGRSHLCLSQMLVNMSRRFRVHICDLKHLKRSLSLWFFWFNARAIAGSTFELNGSSFEPTGEEI